MKAIVGLILLCLVVAIMSFTHKSCGGPHIEANLTETTKKILEREHDITDVDVVFNKHHLTDATAAALPAEAIENLDQVIGMYVPEGAAPAEEEPVEYTDVDFRADRKDGKIIATGTLPDEETRDNLISMLKANAAGKDVVDQTKIAENPTPDYWWKGSPASFIPNLFKGAKGNAFAHYMPKAFKASGEFDKEGPFNAAKGAISLPEGIANDANLVYNKPAPKPAPAPAPAPAPTPEPKPEPLKDPEFYLTEAKNGALHLKGSVDTERTKQKLIETVKSTIPAGSNIAFSEAVKVVEKTAPIKALPKMANLLSSHIKDSKEAEMDYTATSLRLRGVLDSDQKKKGLVKMTSPGISNKRKFLNQLTVEKPAPPKPSPKEEADKLVNDLKPFPVYFDTASAKIKASEEDKIKKAADIINKSGNQSVGLLVGGYADKRGNAEYNKNLSLQRANAVKDRLIKLGVKPARLTVDHFGEDTSNMAEADLWKARRVAISLSK